MDQRGVQETKGSVTCTVCGHGNAPESRFCVNCGNALLRPCPVCSNAVAPTDRFCGQCGTNLQATGEVETGDDLRRYLPETLLHKIRSARATGSMRGERRTVTMLFADLVGSTAAAERLDPEDWAEIANGAFQHLIAPVYRYEGTLARLQGDAILAFFGAPIAHEDDPQRAVRASLDMLASIPAYAAEVEERTGVPIAVRVGINTGLVVVGEVGSDLRVEYTALGDAINVAARMEQTADPGTVRITADTAALLGDAFDLEAIGPVDVKGRSDPVAAFRVLGLADSAAPVTASAPLAGREVERSRVVEAIAGLAQGVGAVITVVGDAGIGKSRLLEEVRRTVGASLRLADTVDADGEVSWLAGNVRSFDRAVPYAAYLDMARRWLGIASDNDQTARDRLDAAVERVGGDLHPDTVVYLAHAGNLPISDQERELVSAVQTPALHEKTTTAIAGYLEAEARRRPLLIVLEDLHWADALSLAMTERLLAAVHRAPIGLLLTLRPVREEPAWRIVEAAAREAGHRHTAIQLDVLEDTAMQALLDALLQGRPLDAPDRDRILARAGGNPLFLEEIVGAMAVGDGEIPASLSGLLSARLDQLAEQERLVAEVAAVAGEEFDQAALAAMIDGDLDIAGSVDALVRRGVLVQRPRLDHPRYAFRHALIQEAAYNLVLLKDRRRLHGRLAQHLESVARGAPYEIARHHLASDNPSAAFPWLVEAANRATRAMALSEAIQLYTTALDNLPPDADPEVVGQAHLGLGEAYSYVPDLDRSSAAYQSLADYARNAARPSLAVRALNQLGVSVALLSGDLVQANRYLEDARALAEETGDDDGLALYHMNACFLAVTRGDLDAAIEHDEATAELGATLGVEHTRAVGLTRRTMNLLLNAQFDEASAVLTDAIASTEAAGAIELRALLRAKGEGQLKEREGDLRTALSLTLEALEDLERVGSTYTAMVEQQAGRYALWLGDLQLAGDLLEAGLARAQRQAPFLVATVCASLALQRAILGDGQDAAARRGQTLANMGTPVADFVSSQIWSDLGSASLEVGDVDTAASDFATGLQQSSVARVWERARLLTGAARAALWRGDLDIAQQRLEEAATFATERGFVSNLPGIGLASGLLAHTRGDLDRAERDLAAAAADAERFGMRLLAADVASLRALVADAQGRPDAAAHGRHRDQLIREVTAGVRSPDQRRRLEERLRQPPHRPRGAATGPPTPLTGS